MPPEIRFPSTDLAQNVAAVPELGQIPIRIDGGNRTGALHRLQTSIQALIDIACYAVALRGLGVPRSSLDALEKLEGAGLLPASSAQRFAPIIGFRNRIVHLYDRVEPQVVYRILTQNRGDLVDLAKLLATALAQ
jgi:uncharacterized protein YutE (UPF0331/DUF86 family)